MIYITLPRDNLFIINILIQFILTVIFGIGKTLGLYVYIYVCLVAVGLDDWSLGLQVRINKKKMLN